MKFGIRLFFENLQRKYNFDYNMTRITGALHEGVSTFMITSSSFLPEMISFKFGVRLFFENRLRKYNFDYNMTKITGALHEGVSTFMITSSSFLPKVISFSDRRSEKIRRHVVCLATFFFFSKFVPFMR